jgi:vancomycin resistance protein YoaR
LLTVVKRKKKSMKKVRRISEVVSLAALMAVLVMVPSIGVKAEEDPVIKDGISIGGVDVSGMTATEAKKAVNNYINQVSDSTIKMNLSEITSVEATPADFGFEWQNEDVVNEAMEIGTTGNILARYKEIKDVENEGYDFDIVYDVDKSLIKEYMQEQSEGFDVEAVNATMTREGGKMVVTEGVSGVVLDVDASTDVVYDALTGDWDLQPLTVDLVAETAEPEVTAEMLNKCTDVLGTFTTSYSSSGAARSQNIATGASHINGTIVMPGEEFSTYNTIKPFTAANGYQMAGSYLNGTVVDSMGGGICQVSTTLYNAVIRAELEVTERNNHSMVVSYVKVSEDAAIAESSGKDFKFVNTSEYPIYIEGYTENKSITFNIYGVETRPAGHKVEFENEILQVINPESETIIADANNGVGYVSVQSAHIGYKARLWKITYEDGVEVSREIFNTSNYKMVPRTAVVGIGTGDPGRQAAILDAINSGSIDYVKGVAAALYQQEIGAVQ